MRPHYESHPHHRTLSAHLQSCSPGQRAWNNSMQEEKNWLRVINKTVSKMSKPYQSQQHQELFQ